MARPTHLSRFPRNTDLSAAMTGSQLLGLPLFKQGLHIASVMEAKRKNLEPMYREVGVLVPRRATKTTAVWAVLLGRCHNIPGYKVVTTAQDGNRARKRFAEVARPLELNGRQHGIRVRWSNGDESLEFDNGSRLWVVAPKAGNFRGEAADAILFDESGEYSPDQSEDLMTGALPLMDTRPDGQVIIAGTPSKTRAGLLWSTINDGRNGKPGTGIVDYSIRDDESSVLLDDEGNVIGLNEQVVRRVHPGLSSKLPNGRALTPMSVIRERFEKMQLPQFEREYLCRFPTDNTTSAINEEAWKAARTERIERPSRVGIAFDAAYDGSSASIVYAWRDSDGIAYIEVVEHRAGTSWVAGQSHRAAQKHRGSAVAFDDIGANRDPATALDRLRPKVKTDRQLTKDIMAAAQRLVSDLTEDRLRHFGQSDLDAAAENVTWRDIAHSGRAFGVRVQAGAAINPMVAASIALWSYDKKPAKTATFPMPTSRPQEARTATNRA